MTGRFAPSPTGDLHLGNLRTALLAWLFARAGGGRFLMRVEDLDRGRVRAGVEERQLADLRAVGVDWDGPVVRQSSRARLYEDAVASLDTYPCYCTRAEIRDAASAPHGALPEGAYPGTCRDLTEVEREAFEAAGRRPALRVQAGGAVVSVEDALAGTLTGGVDDFVVRRGDGAYAYNLAVVVDDASQGVSQVVRGADLAESTPRQVWLAQTLGLAAPSYAHVPLVLGPDGARLAKRHGAVTLRSVPVDEARRWICASVGLDPADPLGSFDPARLPLAPTRYEPGALGPN